MTLKALALNATLKRGSESSSTDAMIATLHRHFADHDVACANALLLEELDQATVGLAKVLDPGVRVDEDHGLRHAERFVRRARGAVPPMAARRSAAVW